MLVVEFCQRPALASLLATNTNTGSHSNSTDSEGTRENDPPLGAQTPAHGGSRMAAKAAAKGADRAVHAGADDTSHPADPADPASLVRLDEWARLDGLSGLARLLVTLHETLTGAVRPHPSFPNNFPTPTPASDTTTTTNVASARTAGGGDALPTQLWQNLCGSSISGSGSSSSSSSSISSSGGVGGVMGAMLAACEAVVLRLKQLSLSALSRITLAPFSIAASRTLAQALSALFLLWPGVPGRPRPQPSDQPAFFTEIEKVPRSSVTEPVSISAMAGDLRLPDNSNSALCKRVYLLVAGAWPWLVCGVPV